MFPRVRSFLVYQVLDLSLLPLAFSLIPPVASRLLHPYSTDDKTSRLTVKRFSTVRDTQRGSQNYMKKGRENKEIRDAQEEKRGNQKGREQSSQQSIPYLLSTVWNTQRGSRISLQKRRRRKDIEVTWRRGRGVKMRETNFA